MIASKSFVPSSPGRASNLRRGWGLLQTVGGMFAGSLVLGVCVPLFITAQRQTDLSSSRARMTLEAREISGHFREDVRQAASVQVAGDGRSLRLDRSSPEQPRTRTSVSYRFTSSGLLREVRTNSGTAERTLYAAALRDVRFKRTGPTVAAELDFSHLQYGRTLDYHLECNATPRSSR